MKKRILIIGQCTLHWGRMEYGNIGNFYIVKPMFQELRRVFPEAEIVTTMQFSRGFCQDYKIMTLPMELYYDFSSENNLSNAKAEFDAIKCETEYVSDYVDEVKRADLVIDFSGDIWGDNADFIGCDRFIVGCYKDMTAQMLKPTVMIAGSPGPFKKKDLELAKKAYAGFKLVVNREPVSTEMMDKLGFDLSKTINCACPSFLFEGEQSDSLFKEISSKNKLEDTVGIKVGVLLCGWNFERGPYDVWPRKDEEYNNIVKTIENLIEKYRVSIYLLSHSNGFDIPPKPFQLKQGRDFPIMQQLKHILFNDGYAQSVVLFDGVYTPEKTKGIIANFDMLISGRMHGAVAGLSQGVPTVIIDYGHEPKAHKLQGFAEVAGVKEYIADPNNYEDLMSKTENCLINRAAVKKELNAHMQFIKKSSRAQFDKLAEYIDM